MSKAMHARLWLPALLAMMLLLAACSNGANNPPADPPANSENDSNSESPSNTPDKEANEDGLFSIEDFNQIKTNQGDEIDGGTLNVGLVSDTPFAGTLNFNFYSSAPDSEVLTWMDEALLTWDASYVYTNDGAATYEISEDGRTFTFTIRDNVNWQDGTPVTAEDWLFAHEVIGHPDYDGPRYDGSMINVEGMAEYHDGTADTISGIEVVSDKQLRITYIEATPSLVTGGIWAYPMAKHIFKDIPVAEMSASAAVRQNPIGFGPYKVESIVPGESVVYVKNPDYWRGEPKLDKVVLRVINPSNVVQEIRTGGVDVVGSFPVDQFPDNANLSNIEWLGVVDRAYTYMGFKLGTWDAEGNKVVPNPDAKMGDVNLRKAMWMAVDNDTVGKQFYKGLRWNATTLIPPSHPEYHDADNPGVAYDPEAAKQLLEEAGYKLNGEFRTKPDGSELVINFISMTGSEIAEPLSRYYVQAWKEIGLNVQLEMIEFNAFYERVGSTGKDDTNVDVYQAAWTVGIDVDPSGLYGRDALYNFSRYANDENDRLLKEGLSAQAFDKDYRLKVYKEWQELMVQEVPVFPTLYRASLVPVNNRVLNYYIGDGTNMYPYNVALSQDKAFVAN